MVNTQNADSVFKIVEQAWIRSFSQSHSFELAFSGGSDSCVLLDIMSRLQQKYNFFLSAVHVHHGLQHQADQWTEFCQRVCHAYQIPLRIKRVKLNPFSSLGLEAEARRHRYQVLMESQQDVIVLAHHQEDQIETFLLSLFRGGELRAMATMPQLRNLAPTLQLWRPLLPVSKAQILQYLERKQLSYIEDPSNREEAYLRNWVRHRLVPLLENKIPHVKAQLLHSINSLQRTLSLVEDWLNVDYQTVQVGRSLSVIQLRQLPLERMKAVIVHFLRQHQLGSPREKSIQAFADWLNKQEGSFYEWQVPGGQVYVAQGRVWPWINSKSTQKLNPFFSFTKEQIDWFPAPHGLPPSFLHSKWKLRSVKKEDTIQTNLGEQSVFNLLKKNKIPLFVRPWWPVVLNEQGICIAVIGLRIDHRYQQSEGLLPQLGPLEDFLSLREKSIPTA
ncbi:MAG: tRNA lysidine(34) synthetase TilS [Neisseriaceae bacterium]